MANAVVAEWTACIKELQQIVDAAAAAQLDGETLAQHLEKLEEHASMPHAAWKRLVQDVQVTAKLTALAINTLQQPDVPHLSKVFTCTVLNVWLGIAMHAMQASPGSRAAATVRQQLQESQLLQHLGPAMDAAAVRLTEAVTGLVATAGSSSNSSNSYGSKGVSATTQHDSIQERMSRVEKADIYCGLLLQLFHRASSAGSQQVRFCAALALPAAPAAMRLTLTGFQVCSRLQQLWQQNKELGALQHGSFAAVGSSFVCKNRWLVFQLVPELAAEVSDNMLQTRPAARELLSPPDLVFCLTIVLLVVVLGLDTSDEVNGTADSLSAISSSNSMSRPSMGSSTYRHSRGTGAQQQEQQQQVWQGSSARDGCGGGGRGCSSRGVLLGSLTPLSCGLFDMLGVSKETVQEAAGLLKCQGVAYMNTVASGYLRVLQYQVNQAKHAFSAKLLLQMETNLLLGLALLQLTASIPDSHPGAQEARDLACQLATCAPLHSLWRVAGLHKLPQPAAYTGPQLALQLLPSPFGPQHLAPELPMQQQEQQQQQQRPLQHEQEPGEWCALAPTAPLLRELVPLLIRHCLPQLQQHQQQLQQQPPNLRMGLPLSAMPLAARPCMMGLFNLLLAAVVPSPGAVAAEVGSAAVGGQDNQVSYECVLQAQDMLMAHACSIISTFEWVLRGEAAACGAATTAAAAAPGAASTGVAAAAAQGAGGSGCGKLQEYGYVFCFIFNHHVSGDYPHYLSPMMLLALAAGPDSEVQRLLHSLLATIAKVSGWGMLDSFTKVQYRTGLYSAASAMLEHHQQLQRQLVVAAAGAGASSSGNAATAIAMLPSVVILGRCFLLRAGELHQGFGSNAFCENNKFDFVVLLPALQQWLQTGSTCDQLVAAGYAPLHVLEQLEQLAATCRAMQDSPSDTSAVLEVALQLRSTGLALCSFAVPCMCNNPGCASMAGPSELASVSGRSCICGGCRVARYCGRACQRAAWKQHKPVCGALSAAAACASRAAAIAPAGAAASEVAVIH